MGRGLKEIYKEAIDERNKRLELSEVNNDSKMSILNAITWVVAAVIFSFEALLDVFALDISHAINNRINGTPIYYANALLQFQKGDTLMIREDGLAFGYGSVDETKQIITQVSFQEYTDDVNLDSKLILKVATGEKGQLTAISQEDLVLVTAYINQIKFAGTRVEVISRKGDVLIPRVTVFYDGAVLESEIYDSIDEALNDHIMNIEFDSIIYVSKIVDTIKGVEHVTDVYVDEEAIPEQGVFVALCDFDGHVSAPKKVPRIIQSNSGYIRESTRKDDEKELPTFRESIKLIVENGQV